MYVAQVLWSVAEHYSNLVPWQLPGQKTGATLRFVHLTPDETLETGASQGLP